MAKFPCIVSPAGTAAFTWLSKPDDKFDKDDPKYKVTLVLDKNAETEAFMSKVEDIGTAHAKEHGPKLKKNFKLPFHDGDDETDRDGNPREEFAGKVLLKVNSKYKPSQFDSARQVLPEGTTAMSGDKIKLSMIVKPYDGFGSGISLKLRNVQLIEKNSTGGGDGAADFEDEEGYVADVPSDVSDSSDEDDNEFD